MKIELDGHNLALSFPYNEIDLIKAKAIPQRRWDKESKRWVFRPTTANIDYVKTWFPNADWSPAAADVIRINAEKAAERDKVARGEVHLDDNLDGIPFKLPPYDHQRRALLLGRDKNAFAYLMDQGTGKTKVCLDDAAHNFRQDRIDVLLIIAPNSVKTNWVSPDGSEDEVSKHLAPDIPVIKHCWMANGGTANARSLEKFKRHISDRGLLKVLAVNVEGVWTENTFKFLDHLCSVSRVMIVVDESTRIKNRTAKRTKVLMKLRKKCQIARIMSGTPLIKSPLDAYSQFNFLDEDIIGYPNFFSFQNHFAIMGGFQNKQVLTFKNLDELSHKVAGVSFRILKEDCLDLPPKVYTKRSLDLTGNQKTLYKIAREKAQSDLAADADKHGRIRSEYVLVQLLRLQQITSGFLPVIDEFDQQIGIQRIEGGNPKLDEISDIMEETEGKVIIWCKFIEEIKMVSELLQKMKIGHCLFYGDISEQDRLTARQNFQEDETTRVFVGQIRTGGIGLTLTAASTVIYFSNSFSTEDRVQSEDRAHRIGQTKSVDYIDLIAAGTVDTKIISVLRSNKRIADEIMKDGIKEWI